jgi:hypothetical protein
MHNALRIYGRRLLEWLVISALGHGIILYLATIEVFPDRVVALMITSMVAAPAWAHWIMAGLFGLLGTFLLERFLWNRHTSLTMSEAGGQSNIDASGKIDKTVEPTIDIRFEPQFQYIKNKIINGNGLSTVLIGLKAVGRTFSNCRVYVEKVAPVPLVPGFPILLVDGAQMLRPDDPETKIAVASKWDHVDTYRFSAPLPPMDSHLWNIKDDPPRLIEIKVTASSNTHDFQKTALFRIRVDQQKKLRLERE